MIRLSANAKVNLGLKITGRRPNGYHELDSIFYPVKFPADELLIEAAGEFTIDCSALDIEPHNNLLLKAYNAFKYSSGYAPAIRITLNKKIPVGAGLGGGSSDTASLLKWLNNQNPLPQSELLRIAAQTGADVPFFLLNRPARVRGIGENLKELPAAPSGYCLLLVWPQINVNTAWAFKAYDEIASTPEKNLTNKKLKANNNFTSAEHGEIEVFALRLENDLEEPVFKRFPQLNDIKNQLLNLGSLYSGMSGSGSTITGLFNDFKLAQKAAKTLRKNFKYVFFAPL